MLVSATDHSSPRPAAAAGPAGAPGPAGASVAVASRHLLLQLLLLMGMLYLTTPVGAFSSLGVMQPPDPLVQSNNTLVLNCTLTNHSLPFNASHIAFKLGSTVLPSKYVRAITPWTAELRLPDVKRNISGIHMFCSLPNDHQIAHQVITVADPPKKPQITECIVYNWSNMTCYWEPKKQDTGLETTQELIYTLLAHSEEPAWESCPTDLPNENFCIWPTEAFYKGLTYALLVRASNFLHPDVYSEVVFCHTRLKVKPDPVKDLKVDEVTNTTIKVSWQPPSVRKDLRYNVTYYSEFTGVQSKFLPVFTSTGQDEILLQGLKPFSDYTIEVSSIPLVDEKPQGYQSNIERLKQRTRPGVPESNPELGPGSFYVHEGRVKRNVTIYWQPVPPELKNAAHLCYVVECRGNHGDVHEEKVCHDQFSVSFKLAKEEDYEVAITAESEIGRNTTLSPSTLVVPAMLNLLPSVPDLIPVVWNQSHCKISWTPVECALTYTLFFCKKIGGILCKEPPSWQTYSRDLNETTANLAVSSSDYIFAMSVQYEASCEVDRHRRSLETLSSGLFWSKCVYHYVEKLETPEKFKASKLQSAGSLSVDWSHPGCSYGYIETYIIYYCLKEKCQKTQSSVRASYRDYTKIWSKGLEVDKQYYVWMTATSPYSNASNPTKKILMTVRRSGLTMQAAAGVAVACLIVSVLIICGICHVVKYVVKKWRRLMDEVPITSPGIERIGQSNLDTQRIIYTGETLGGSRSPPEHSGMTRIAENESNALLENNFNRRTYRRNEGNSHEQRALLMNGNAVHGPGSLTLQLEPMNNLQEMKSIPMVPRSNLHSYYNNSTETVDPDTGQYDAPNSRSICPDNSANRLNDTEQEDLPPIECEPPVSDDDAQEIENSGQSSIGSYAVVDQCLPLRTPPILPILEENLESLPFALTNHNGAADIDSGKSDLSLEEECNKMPKGGAPEGTGYTLNPPQTVHSLTQQNKANDELGLTNGNADHTKNTSDCLNVGYVPLPPNPTLDDQSTVSHVSSLPGRVPLLKMSGYVALPNEIPSSRDLFLEPPNVVDSEPSDGSMCTTANTDPVSIDPGEGDRTKLLHSLNDHSTESDFPQTTGQDLVPQNNNMLDRDLSSPDNCSHPTSSKHNSANKGFGIQKCEGGESDHDARRTVGNGSSGAGFCLDYVTLPSPLNVGTEVKWNALHTDQTV